MNADSTHPHPKARASSLLVARAAEYVIIHRKPLLDIISSLKHEIKDIDEETFRYLEAVDQLPPHNIGRADYTFNDPSNVPSDTHIELLCGPQPVKEYLTLTLTLTNCNYSLTQLTHSQVQYDWIEFGFHEDCWVCTLYT